MMDAKHTKEVHSTEYIDKKLPTIFYKKETIKSLSEADQVLIEVSDTTSEAALDTFKKVKELVASR